MKNGLPKVKFDSTKLRRILLTGIICEQKHQKWRNYERRENVLNLGHEVYKRRRRLNRDMHEFWKKKKGYEE